MAELQLQAHSAWSGLTLAQRPGVVELCDPGPAARLIYRGSAAAAKACGFRPELPDLPLQARSEAGRSALWLGPDEWLLLAAAGDAPAMRAALAAALDSGTAVLADVSHRSSSLIIQGPAAAMLLNAGCALDLDPAAFAPHQCSRTLLGKAEIVLWRQASDRFHLEIARSHALYVATFLAAALADLDP